MDKLIRLSDHRPRRSLLNRTSPRADCSTDVNGPQFQPALLLYYPQLSLVEICVSAHGLKDIARGVSRGYVSSSVVLDSAEGCRYAVAHVDSLDDFVALAYSLRSAVVPHPYYLDSIPGAKMTWNRAGFIPPEGDDSYVLSVDFSPMGSTWVFGAPKSLSRAVDVLSSNDLIPLQSVGRLEGDVACFNIPTKVLRHMKFALKKEGIATLSHLRIVNSPPPRRGAV